MVDDLHLHPDVGLGQLDDGAVGHGHWLVGPGGGGVEGRKGGGGGGEGDRQRGEAGGQGRGRGGDG